LYCMFVYFCTIINLKFINMKRIDLLKYAIYVLAVCALAMFNSGCEKENLKEDCLSNVNCKYVF